MSQEENSASTITFDAALDAVLVSVLSAPALPLDFRLRLRAALARAGDSESIETQRMRLESEHRDGLAELRHVYAQLFRRTLAVLLGAGLVLGTGIALLFPWLSTTMGAHTGAAMAVFGGIAGLALGIGASRSPLGSLMP